MPEKYLYSLNRLFSRKIDNGNDYQAWKSEALNIIIKIYGENSHFIKELKNIRRINSTPISLDGGNGANNFPGSDNLKGCITRCKSLIKIIIEDIETYGPPEKKDFTSDDQKDIKLSVFQTNNNTQTVNLNLIIDQLEKELSFHQLEEIRNILKSASPDKKGQVLNKLKSFGSDVCANIIAGLLTNPGVFS